MTPLIYRYWDSRLRRAQYIASASLTAALPAPEVGTEEPRGLLPDTDTATVADLSVRTPSRDVGVIDRTTERRESEEEGKEGGRWRERRMDLPWIPEGLGIAVGSPAGGDRFWFVHVSLRKNLSPQEYFSTILRDGKPLKYAEDMTEGLARALETRNPGAVVAGSNRIIFASFPTTSANTRIVFGREWKVSSTALPGRRAGPWARVLLPPGPRCPDRTKGS